MTSSGLRTAGRLFGIDLAGLFKDDEDGKGFLGLNPNLSFSTTSKGRGGALSFRPQQQTGVTSTLGFGGAQGGINNINVVGSNFGQGNMLDAPSTEEPTPTPSEPEPTPTQPFFEAQDVQFSRSPMDYTKDLSKQEAVGKANQLLRRTLGDKIGDQETYNRLFDPLLKDLQKGDDYGFDIDRLYKNIRAEGFEPYKDVITKAGAAPFGGKGAEGGADAYSAFVNQQFSADKPFFDQADAGRRFLEAKAFFRPGGDDTKLDRIGQIQNRFDAYEMGFKGQGGDAYGDTGYRTGNVTGSLKPFYETYLEGLNATNPRASAPDSPDRPAQSNQKMMSGDMPAPKDRFEDFDYAAYGQGGFGLQDVRALIDKGATSDEILKVGRRAKDRGLNVGPNVGNLFSELMG
jgi:hypothetical protein|tara:strand:+ start:228 stop:1433 length:1206 start_codon:yes stop_codon:yes gene_type:complete